MGQSKVHPLKFLRIAGRKDKSEDGHKTSSKLKGFIKVHSENMKHCDYNKEKYRREIPSG